MNKIDFAVGIGGENGQGIASTGNILALIFARRGLHLNAYNAYQSIIRGGHTFLTIRAGDGPVRNMGDKIDVFIPLNQDTMDRHLHLLKSGACAIYDKEKVTPGKAAEGVQLCAMPMKELTKGNKLAVNTAALGATLQLLGIESEPLETVISRQFKKKGDAVVAENLAIARANCQKGMTATDDRLVSVVGVEMQPAPRKDKRQNVPSGSDPLAVLAPNADCEINFVHYAGTSFLQVGA